jgi:hypothetical protein
MTFQVKHECEERLVNMLSTENFKEIDEIADRYNAERLKEYCQWFSRQYKRQI